MARSVWRWLQRLWTKPAAEPPPARPLRAKHEGLNVRQKLERYPEGHVTLAGDVVQSKPERRIADLLYKRGIRYVYEAQLEGATPDFFLPEHNIVIEHWGMDHSKYREKRAMKTRLYLSRGYKLVETEKKDVPYLERALESRLLKVDPDIFERARR